jgi:signal transduction histidine kinase
MPDAMADPYGSAFGRIGVGIAGMRERMKELSGKLEIYSTSTGTTVRASVPRKTT